MVFLQPLLFLSATSKRNLSSPPRDGFFLLPYTHSQRKPHSFTGHSTCTPNTQPAEPLGFQPPLQRAGPGHTELFAFQNKEKRVDMRLEFNILKHFSFCEKHSNSHLQTSR